MMEIDNRVADVTRQPKTHQESIQVLRYNHAEKYDVKFNGPAPAMGGFMDGSGGGFGGPGGPGGFGFLAFWVLLAVRHQMLSPGPWGSAYRMSRPITLAV
jgi:hypothetical protein